ncbi:MAG: MmgE/PrpD family protein [Rhizobacter sp.]|nr:MmgE/PrpD family protein [Rhizobacter sp.]
MVEPNKSLVSQRIAAYVVANATRVPPPAHRHAAFRALLDTYACAVAGRHEDAPRLARRSLDEVVGRGTATTWLGAEKMPAESAAFVNGVLGHVLDYDDVMSPMRGHPSVSIVPALLALAEGLSGPAASGTAFARAYLVGFEVIAKLSRALAIGHYAKGWHSTSSLGMIGCTAACASLLGLNEAQTADALGLAVAQAAGSRQNFGTMAKSFQAGHCAASAVRAAKLAQLGFTAAHDALDGEFGFAKLYGAGENLAAAFASLGLAPTEIEAAGIEVKKYPCCYATHRALDGVLDLRREHGLSLAGVVRVDILSNHRGLDPLLHDRPQTGLEGKFSMEYAVVAALVDGQVRLSTFDDAAVQRADVQSALPRVHKSEADGPPFPRFTEVTLTLNDGRTLRRRVNTARGDAADPLSDAELVDKVADCLSYARCGGDAAALAAHCFALGDKPVASLRRVLPDLPPL